MDRLDLAKKVGYVPQRSNGNYMTVFDALLLGRKPHIKWEISQKDIEITENVLKLLDLDEPTNNLDLKNQLEVMRILKDVSVSENITSIIVMHDINLALRYSDKFLMLKDGKIFAEGGKEIINTQNIVEVYGVNTQIHDLNGQLTVVPGEGY